MRSELTRFLAVHRVALSDAQRFVQVEPETPQEVSFVVGWAARTQVAVLPVPARREIPAQPDWHVRLSLARMSAVTDFSAGSGLMCVQSGALMKDVAAWLDEKGRTLAVSPDPGEEVSVWEFALAPGGGRFGPRYGPKWQQVFQLTAVLPSGTLYRTSFAPARATGPDFTRLVLMGQGRFGLPLEVYFRVKPLPPRRMVLLFSARSVADAVQGAWGLAGEVVPEYLEVAASPRVGLGRSAPAFVLVELWGEGKRLGVRREQTRKVLGPDFTLVDLPQEMSAGVEETLELPEEDSVSAFVPRPLLARLLAGKVKPAGELRVRGFLDGHAWLTGPRRFVARAHLDRTASLAQLSGEHAADLLDAAATRLDPGRVFAAIPRLFQEEP
jgi:FAD/FMN-containing dehydrogenase